MAPGRGFWSRLHPIRHCARCSLIRSVVGLAGISEYWTADWGVPSPVTTSTIVRSPAVNFPNGARLRFSRAPDLLLSTQTNTRRADARLSSVASNSARLNSNWSPARNLGSWSIPASLVTNDEPVLPKKTVISVFVTNCARRSGPVGVLLCRVNGAYDRPKQTGTTMRKLTRCGFVGGWDCRQTQDLQRRRCRPFSSSV